MITSEEQHKHLLSLIRKCRVCNKEFIPAYDKPKDRYCNDCSIEDELIPIIDYFNKLIKEKGY